MNHHRLICTLAAVVTSLFLTTAARAADVAVEHMMVYHEKGRFGGWPANHGIWSWGNEILVGFSTGFYKDLGEERHNIDRERPEEHVLARSLDGGRTWSINNPSEQHILVGTAGMRHGTLPPGASEPEPVDCPGGIDFTHPDFVMTCRMGAIHTGVSRFYYSYDRGHSWKGPFRIPLFDQPGIAARTDYIVNGPHDCHLFLTASKSHNRQGRPHHRRRELVEARLLHRPRAQRLLDHALQRPAVAARSRHDAAAAGRRPETELDRGVAVGG